MIEPIETDAGPDAEARWILHYRAMGADLLNARSGGGSGGSFDAASRARLSASNREAFLQPSRRGVRRGENGTNARLLETEVIEMRARYAEGGITHKALAAQYGVDRTTVGKILSRALWAHV